jgi:hypothetical protein
MMSRISCLFIAVSFLLPGSALAEDPYADAKGELHVQMNLAYAKVEVNGVGWDETEFRSNGKTLVVTGLDRSQEVAIKVIASEDGYADVEFSVQPKRFQKKRKKGVVRFIAKKKIRFKAAPKEKEAEPTEAAPEPTEAAPEPAAAPAP